MTVNLRRRILFMLEMFVVRETVFFLTGVMIGIGAIARLITGISLKKLVRAASNMSKSNHPLMRLVRAKFEHGCMVSDKVQNVGAFVEKYLYEYRVLGVRLHTWRQWAKGSIWLCLIFGATGTALAYAAGRANRDFTDMVFWAVWELWRSFYSGCLRMMPISWRQRKPIW